MLALDELLGAKVVSRQVDRRVAATTGDASRLRCTPGRRGDQRREHLSTSLRDTWMRKLTAPPAIALSLAVATPVYAAGVSVNGSRVLPRRYSA